MEILRERRIMVQTLPDNEEIKNAIDLDSHITKYWDGKTPYIKVNGNYYSLKATHKLPQLVNTSNVSVIVYIDKPKAVI
jgi:hypothetical protein